MEGYSCFDQVNRRQIRKRKKRGKEIGRNSLTFIRFFLFEFFPFFSFKKRDVDFQICCFVFFVLFLLLLLNSLLFLSFILFFDVFFLFTSIFLVVESRSLFNFPNCAPISGFQGFLDKISKVSFLRFRNQIHEEFFPFFFLVFSSFFLISLFIFFSF